MDIKQRRLVTSLAALLLICAATVTQAIELLSDEEKKASLEAFSLNASKEAKKAKTSEEYIPYDRQQILDQYLDGEKYVIRFLYLKDADFPEMYNEATYFKVDKSRAFYEQATKEIFTHYLGGHFEQLTPSLRVVTKAVVGIDVRIETVEQLEKLLDDARIVVIEHLTFHQTETIYQ